MVAALAAPWSHFRACFRLMGGRQVSGILVSYRLASNALWLPVRGHSATEMAPEMLSYDDVDMGKDLHW